MVVVTVVAEIGLRIFLPAQVVTIGRAMSENGLRYGWGFDSNESIIVSDPDTGELFVDQANSRGWRDREHKFENENNAFRIVVLGDSITFGAIVDQEKNYPQVLEKKFLNAGFNVEVVSLAYGGVGTDQELEFLIQEGVRYNPDIVLLQFTYNDLGNITKEVGIGKKPFIYALDDAGKLIKRPDEQFHATVEQFQQSIRHKLKALANYSEIAKRLYILYRTFVGRQERDSGYFVDKSQFKRLEHAFGISMDDSPLGQFLQANMGKLVDKEEILRLVDASGYGEFREEILRLCEKRWFHRFSDREFFPKKPDPTSEQWKLLFALFDKIHETAKATGARLEVISDNEQGFLNWQRYWFRYHSSEEARKNYLMPTQLIKQWANEKEAGFIDFIAPIERARNDPHPNNTGYETMAESLFRSIKSKYSAELSKYVMK